MTCFRVLMFDAKQELHWQPIFVGESLGHVTERARTMYPMRTVVDVLPLHLRQTHGWHGIATVAA